MIFPVIGEQTFEALVREGRALGMVQSRRVHAAVRAWYGPYYRRMIDILLPVYACCFSSGGKVGSDRHSTCGGMGRQGHMEESSNLRMFRT